MRNRVGRLAQRLEEAASSIDTDGTPSQVGLSAAECREVADVLYAFAAAVDTVLLGWKPTSEAATE